MIAQVSKLIVRAVVGIAIILLVVESSMIIPAYFSVVFNTHAIATNGARNNYITNQDISNLISNITVSGNNDRFDTITVDTTILEIQPDGNTMYSSNDTYGQVLSEAQTLQRGDRYVIEVEAVYYFLTPKIWQYNNSANEDRRVGIPFTITYEVPITCLKYFKR